MDYKGYNIAIHELGHNVEQVFSFGEHRPLVLAGVPNNAFTEALAFIFQAPRPGASGSCRARRRSAAAHEALATTSGDTYEIGGVALVDMGVWRWMYAHPDAILAELREATLGIARDVWNR